MPSCNEESGFENLKPIIGEPRYVDYDSEFEQWGVFGSDSGFCYATFCDKQEAKDYLNPVNK